MNDRLVSSLDDLPASLFRAAGGKAGTLARLRQAGHPVPDGVVLLPGAFRAATLLPEAWQAILDWVVALPGRVGREGPPTLAVRSSALSEDSAGASFAGASVLCPEFARELEQ